MSDKNEPAFPTHSADNLTDPRERILSGGMALRDYFAGQALASVMHLCARDTMIPDETIEASFARKSYEIADAMMTERARRQ